mmetsp:Transcript_113544/g.285407  ORF Transcript_113544/g.285407 Transcript_113544/m.285407 type:complete len:83 (-) Transcript_113544:143-391(-)
MLFHKAYIGFWNWVSLLIESKSTRHFNDIVLVVARREHLWHCGVQASGLSGPCKKTKGNRHEQYKPNPFECDEDSVTIKYKT